MKITLLKSFLGVLCAFAGIMFFTACDPKEAEFQITELMASNKTGHVAADGKTHDWIEIRNVSDKVANLKGYTLEKDSGKVKWEFPDKELQPNEYVLVYASKNEVKGEMSCGFKLKANGDSVKLVAPHGTVVSNVAFDKLKDDQALKLTKKGKYKKTYYQTPGFENTDKGREEYFKFLEAQRKDPIKIWECSDKSKNKDTASWVELKNTSDKPVDLSSYVIVCAKDSCDTLSVPKQTLEPGALLVVTDTKNVLKGQCVILMKGSEVVDAVNTVKAYMDTSIGRMSGKDGFFYFKTPTQNQENSGEATREVTEEAELETKAGAYKETSLYIKADSKKKRVVHYTTDGSIPTVKSPILKDSIKITKTTILHTLAVDSGCMESPVGTHTYILGVQHTLPVVCVTVNHSDLFDYNTGIYADGPGGGGEFPHKGANYWKKWEKFAHVEFCDGKKGFSYDCGLKIFGGFSRALPKKSFHLKLHGKYGPSRYEYDIFNTGKKEKAKSICLRSGSQDYTGTMVRDEFFTSLLKADCPNMYIQKNRPVVLYLNGEYWGIYYIREKVNADYVANHLDVNPETVTLLMAQKGPLVGSNQEYINLVNYAINHDTRNDSVYKYLQDRVDFESLIDFKLGEFYCSNSDAGNIRYFKSSDPKCDGKWHWLFYDLDASFACIKPTKFYLEGNTLFAEASSVGPYNVLICQLLKNPNFRKLFLEHWANLRKKTFEAKHATEVFDNMIKTIQPEMERECQRWPQMSYVTWQKKVSDFREKLTSRLPLIDQEFVTGMALTAEEKKAYMP